MTQNTFDAVRAASDTMQLHRQLLKENIRYRNINKREQKYREGLVKVRDLLAQKASTLEYYRAHQILSITNVDLQKVERPPQNLLQDIEKLKEAETRILEILQKIQTLKDRILSQDSTS